jgi:DNA topoisomerase-6 subunit A
MAKKKEPAKPAADPSKLKVQDRKTLDALRTLAQEVLDYAERGRAPHIEVPSRSLSNVRFNQSRKIIEMGSGTNRRELFNLAQAKSYMQTLLVSSGCKLSLIHI